MYTVSPRGVISGPIDAQFIFWGEKSLFLADNILVRPHVHRVEILGRNPFLVPNRNFVKTLIVKMSHNIVGI